MPDAETLTYPAGFVPDAETLTPPAGTDTPPGQQPAPKDKSLLTEREKEEVRSIRRRTRRI